MKHLIIIFIFFYSSVNSYCQNTKVNELAISSTFIFNNTTIFNSYAGARAKDKSGNALSNGFDIAYSKSFYKGFYSKAGIGYFNQKFGIIRGFDFRETVTTTGLGYSTKDYRYKNLNFLIGLGYTKSLSKGYDLNFCVTYNYLNTFQQEYKHTGARIFLGNINPQLEYDNYHFGSLINLQAGVNKNLYKNLKFGIDLVLPVSTRWRKDEIFREDVDEFYSSNFLIGGSINLIYSFNKK